MPSYTDRTPREGELESGVYNFVSTEEFEAKIKEGEFYEYSVHHEHYYGTSKKILNEYISSGKIVVKDIEVNGTENLLKILKNEMKMVTIFLRVPKPELRKRPTTKRNWKHSVEAIPGQHSSKVRYPGILCWKHSFHVAGRTPRFALPSALLKRKLKDAG